MRGYRSLLLLTLTPAKVFLCRRATATIITSRTICVVSVGWAIENAMLARRMALGAAASTGFPTPRIQVPEQVLALLQERLLLALRVLKDNKFSISHLYWCRHLALLSPLSHQFHTSSKLAYLYFLFCWRRWFLFFFFIFIRRYGCRRSGFSFSIFFFSLRIIMNWNKDTLSRVVTNRQISLRELSDYIIHVSVNWLVILGAFRCWNLTYHLILLEEDTISEHSYRQFFIKVSVVAFLIFCMALVIGDVRRAGWLCQ